MTERILKAGDRVAVKLVTEVVCVRPDGQVLRMIGMPVPTENIRKIKTAGLGGEDIEPAS